MQKKASKKDTVLRDWNCEACGATVLIKLGAKTAYYWCDGRADDRQCGHRSYFAPMPTRKIVEAAHAAAEQQKGPDNVEPQETAVTATATPEAPADSGTGNDPGTPRAAKSGGFKPTWDW